MPCFCARATILPNPFLWRKPCEVIPPSPFRNPHSAIRMPQSAFRIPHSAFKKVLLPQMTKIRAHLERDLPMVIDDQAHVRPPQHRLDFQGQPAGFLRRTVFGPQLDQIRPSFAKLAGDRRRRPTSQAGRVHKRIKPALVERFQLGKFLAMFILPSPPFNSPFPIHNSSFPLTPALPSIPAAPLPAIAPERRSSRCRAGNSGPARSPAQTRSSW